MRNIYITISGANERGMSPIEQANELIEALRLAGIEAGITQGGVSVFSSLWEEDLSLLTIFIAKGLGHDVSLDDNSTDTSDLYKDSKNH